MPSHHSSDDYRHDYPGSTPTRGFTNRYAFHIAIKQLANPSVYARECFTNETEPVYAVSHFLTLTSPDQLTPLEDCETLIGDIEIDIAFSGSIVLNSVTNFTGRLVSFPDGYNTGLEAIEMRNLRTIQVIRLNRIQGLRSIQMPRLEEVSGKLDFSQEAEDAWMDFSALRSFLMSSMTGTWAKYVCPLNTILFSG